jgi:hypothetical protein
VVIIKFNKYGGGMMLPILIKKNIRDFLQGGEMIEIRYILEGIKRMRVEKWTTCSKQIVVFATFIPKEHLIKGFDYVLSDSVFWLERKMGEYLHDNFDKLNDYYFCKKLHLKIINNLI